MTGILRFFRNHLIAFTLALHASRITGIAIRNSVVGNPIVKCEDDRVIVSVPTQEIFNGRIFVKGKSTDNECSRRFVENRVQGAVFNVPLGRCGMQRLRSTQPRGMNYMLTTIVSFHNIFITKPDRAYHIRCFYMEGTELVSAQLDVSMVTTQNLHDSMEMPTCDYTVRFDSPSGPIARYANVGDQVYHVWNCVGFDMGILVKSCTVNGNGEENLVVDQNGCVVDSSLIDPLTYEPTLMRVYAQSYVFKYADRNNLFFTCEIQMCQKRLSLCNGVTPPRCALLAEGPRFREQHTTTSTPQPTAFDIHSHHKRAAIPTDQHNGSSSSIDPQLKMEVATPEILVLNLDSPNFPSREFSEELEHQPVLQPIDNPSKDATSARNVERLQHGEISGRVGNLGPWSYLPTKKLPAKSRFCISTISFTIGLSLIMAVVSIVVAAAIYVGLKYVSAHRAGGILEWGHMKA